MMHEDPTRQSLKGKKILMIAPKFFGYEVDIKKALETQGAVVHFISDRPFDAPALKAVLRVQRNWVLPFANRFYLRELAAFNENSYDYIFTIIGEGLSKKILRFMREKHPHAKFILYMWDAMKNKSGLVENLPYFDKVFTFDPQDSQNYKMQFRPLFFAPGFESNGASDYKHDLSFIGTAHSDRYAIIRKVRQSLPSGVNFYSYLFLQAPWMYWVHRISNKAFKGGKITDFSFLPLAKTKVHEIFAQSKAIVDIEHPQQRGLTMRTFEALGAQKKLITTNTSVKAMDFFNAQNILVVDRSAKLEIPKDFFSSPYSPLPAEQYKKYSLNGWIEEVFNLS